MGLRGKISLSRSAAEHFPIEFRRGRGWLLLPTDNHGLRRRVRTASGSDRIRKSREIYLGPVRCNPFREVSFLIRGDFLIRSLPLAVLTHPVTPWATELPPASRTG